MIVEGEPGDAERECFPPALRFKLGLDGALTDEREEPIAADARPQGDGKEIAKQKLVAGLLGLGLDEIVRRAEQAQRRHARLRNGIIGVLVALTLASASGFAWARHELTRNEALLDRTLQRATGFVDKAVAMSEKLGVPRTISLGILDEAESMFRDMAELGRETPQLRYRKALMLIAFARNYEVLGQTDAQRIRATEALRLLSALAAEKHGGTSVQKDLSAAYIEVGNVQVAQGHLANALSSYRQAHVIAERLFKADPANAVWQRGLSLAYEKVGDILSAQGSLAEALIAFEDGLAIDRRLAADEPGNARAQRDLSVSYNKIGDLKRATGDNAGALMWFRDSLDIRARLVAADPTHPGRLRDFAVSHGKIGDILFRRLDFDEALKFFSESLTIREGLARTDPSNAAWQRDLSVAYNKVGDAQGAQGNRVEALTSYRAGLAIAERLAKADPANADWQRDLMLSQDNVGRLTISNTR